MMPAILDVLESNLLEEEINENIVLAGFGSLVSIVDTLPQFVSPYITQMLKLAFNPVVLSFDETGNKNHQVITIKKSELLNGLSMKVPARIMLPAVYKHLAGAKLQGKSNLLALFKLTGDIIANMAKSDITEQHKKLVAFFVEVFDYRRLFNTTVSEDDICQIEKAGISAFMHLVMKLNESLFKPSLLKIVEWATTGAIG